MFEGFVLNDCNFVFLLEESVPLQSYEAGKEGGGGSSPVIMETRHV